MPRLLRAAPALFFVAIALVAGGTAPAAHARTDAVAAPTRPNIVYVLTDDR